MNKKNQVKMKTCQKYVNEKVQDIMIKRMTMKMSSLLV